MDIKDTVEDPPAKEKPGGRKTRYQGVIDRAKKDPGVWRKLEGQHHSSNISTLKGHGLTVRSKRATEKHRHYLWVCYQPEGES